MNETANKFLEDFKAHTDGIAHISSGSAIRDCRECMTSTGIEWFESHSDDGETATTEPYFSWSPCDTCGSTLGGTREDGHGFYDGSLIHLAMCVDCVAYVANGTLPDSE